MRSLNSTNKLLSFANGWGTHHHGGHTCLEPFSAYCHPHSHPTLQGNNAPPAPPDCEPQCLLTIPGSPNPWLASHLPTTLRSGTVTQWLNKLKLPQAQLNTIQSNWAKAESWWQTQLASAVDTIQRVAIMSGIPISLLQKNFDADQLLRVLTIAITMAN